jgi:hypothetical protein
MVGKAISCLPDAPHAALAFMRALKQTIEGYRPMLDGYVSKLDRHLSEVKMLQMENCELQLELARLRHDEENIFVYEELLKGFEEDTADAIAGLDSDC